MSRTNRNRFMRTVREALGHAGNLPRQAPPGLFPKEPSPKSLERLERIRNRQGAERRVLIERLKSAAQPINLEIDVVDSAAAASAAIVQKAACVPTEWGGPRKACAWDHPLIDSLGLEAMLAEHGIPLVSAVPCLPSDTGQARDEKRAGLRKAIASSYVGITAADFCVADTATLVLRTRPGQPRSVSLVPSIHMAVITADQIVADFKELYASLRWGDPSSEMDLTTCMTFISGPSKTADIEATLVHGAHGPRALYLVVIDGK